MKLKRREMLSKTAAGVVGLSAFPLGWAAAAEPKKKQRMLYFTRSVEYEHSVVARGDDGLSHSGRILIELGKQAGFEVECSKDGRVFDRDLDQYDAIVAYLHEKGLLIPGESIRSGDRERLAALAKRAVDFLRTHRDEIDENICGRPGYLEANS